MSEVKLPEINARGQSRGGQNNNNTNENGG
jgi:hypothetical protein